MSYKEDLKLVESVVDTKADISKLSEANKALVRLEKLVAKADFALLESNYTNEIDELKRENAELKAKLDSIKYALGIKDDEDEDNEH